eukprot:scaffold6090_cov326-Prasinococcus_capsulatus_cf.AAC.4
MRPRAPAAVAVIISLSVSRSRPPPLSICSTRAWPLGPKAARAVLAWARQSTNVAPAGKRRRSVVRCWPPGKAETWGPTSQRHKLRCSGPQTFVAFHCAWLVLAARRCSSSCAWPCAYGGIARSGTSLACECRAGSQQNCRGGHAGAIEARRSQSALHSLVQGPRLYRSGRAGADRAPHSYAPRHRATSRSPSLSLSLSVRSQSRARCRASLARMCRRPRDRSHGQRPRERPTWSLRSSTRRTTRARPRMRGAPRPSRAAEEGRGRARTFVGLSHLVLSPLDSPSKRRHESSHDRGPQRRPGRRRRWAPRPPAWGRAGAGGGESSGRGSSSRWDRCPRRPQSHLQREYVRLRRDGAGAGALSPRGSGTVARLTALTTTGHPSAGRAAAAGTAAR